MDGARRRVGACVAFFGVLPGLSISLLMVAAGPDVQVGMVQPAAGAEVPARHVEEITPRVLKELGSIEELEVRALDVAVEATCVSRECLLPIAADSDITHLLRSQLEVSEQDYELRLEVVEVESGAVVASAVGSCEVCTEVEIGEMLSRTGARLREPLAALIVQASIIVVDGSPDGARVAIDGQEVGAAPYQGEVAPGKHQLVVTASEHESHTEGWLAEAGETHTSSFRLRPIDTSEPSETLRRAGWAGLGLGFAGIATGAVLLALHDRPVKSSCPDGMTDENGRCPDMYGTLGGGLASMSVGIVVAAVGGTLLGVDAKRRRARVAVSPRSVTVQMSF